MYQHKINNKNLKLYGAIEATPAGEQDAGEFSEADAIKYGK